MIDTRKLGGATLVAVLSVVGTTEAQAQDLERVRSVERTATVLQAYQAIGADRVGGVWFPQDSADGLYRRARAEFNRANFDEAIRLFREVQQRYAQSAYVAQAMYYEAFSLYRKGEENDLHRALDVLQVQKERFPDDATGESAVLAARIQGSLARRGDVGAAEQLAMRAEQLARQEQVTREREHREQARQAARGAREYREQAREQEEDDVRMTALNALMHMDAENAMPILRRVLANRTDETVGLRRKAVFLVAQKRTEDREEILLDAARNDPDAEVRMHAVFHLSSVRTPEAVAALDSILQFSTEPEIQERALFALSQHRSDRAAEILQAYARRSDVPPELRAHAIQWLGHHEATDAAFIRDLYRELDDPELKEKALFALSQRRDTSNADFLFDIALDESEPMEMRKRAIFWVGQMQVVSERLHSLYDGIADVEMKEQLIFAFAQNHDDSTSVDKLIDIVRNETNPDLRNKAIFWLGQAADPRVARILEEIINND